jgi:putative redox protein
MQMVLISHGACSLIDVIAGLKDRMVNVRSSWVEVDADRAEDAPRVFTAVRMKYVIEGNVPEKLVNRLIEQSHEKYCSVGAMITGSGATLDWDLDIRI